MERVGTIAIVGVGLIGGSIGLAARARRIADRVVGIGRDPEKLAQALELGAIDEATTNLANGVTDSDVAIVCTPVSRIAAECLAIAEVAPERTLITDAGSTKAAIVAAVEASPRARARFCGSHPIAGSERQGVAHARADLFVGRSCVVAPSARTPASLFRRASAFWEALGGRVVAMSPEAHDAALALTSHLPHAVASALAATVPVDLYPLAAGAFRDGTRVAAADPTLWSEIFLANREGTLAALAALEERLDEFRHLLAAGDSAGLDAWWKRGKAARDRFSFHAPTTHDDLNRGPS